MWMRGKLIFPYLYLAIRNYSHPNRKFFDIKNFSVSVKIVTIFKIKPQKLLKINVGTILA